MDQEPDSWIKTPAFDWTPETPLSIEPKFTGTLPVEPWAVEPRAAEPPAAEPRFENPRLSEPVTAQPPKAKVKPKPLRVEKPWPRLAPVRARIGAITLSLFQARMVVGLAQGASLFALFAWRASFDPFVFSAALMVFLFAPLLLLAGLGRMTVSRLLVWALFASVLLAAVGAYHRWRTLSSDGGHPGLALLALTSLFLSIGQSVAEGQVGDYGSYYRAAWRLAIRIVCCALLAGFSWVALGAASDFMREHYPMLQFAPLIMPLVALSAALAAHLTGEKFLGVLQEGLVFVFAIALPPLLLLAIAAAALGISGFWHPSFAVSASLGLLLVVSINASYRDGTNRRPSWRWRAEFAASLMLVPLSLIAAFALAARVGQFGWTDGRIFAAAGLLLMSGYALCYTGSALISLGGGGWMQRIEGSNLALAFASLMLIAALASPVADPARRAVAAQNFRLEQHRIAPEAFDFTWLRDGGLRFGRQALDDMAAAQSMPAIARGAFLALHAPPMAARPTPTQIGANIHVHSAAGLPGGFLARDWSGVEGAPPCLTSASLGCDAFFFDLDGDGSNEILLAYGNDARWWASVMKQGAGGGWYVAGTLAAPPCPGSLTALRDGQFKLVRPAGNWRDLVVDGIRLSIDRPRLPAGCPTS